MDNYYKLYGWILKSDLSPNEKLLLAILHGLSEKRGYCRAGKPYLANELNVTTKRIQQMLSVLEKKGFIVRDYTNNKHEIIPVEKEFLRK